MRVLIVEDELLIALSISEYLKEIGAEPLNPVPSGELAVSCALEEKPDLILMDIRIGGNINGIEAAQQIRNTLNVPIIFMTGYTTEAIKEMALSMDFTEFLEKPVSMYRLKSMIDSLIKTSSA